MDPHFEEVQSDEGSSLRCLYFSCEKFADDHTWHYHPEFELSWITRSTGTRFVGDSIDRYAPGDLVLIGPNLPHCWHNDAECDEPGELIVVQFDPQCFGEGFLALPEVRKVRALLDEARGGVHFSGDTVRHAGELLRALVASKGMARLIRLLQVLNVLSKSQSRTILAQPGYHLNNDINQVNRERIERVHEYVYSNLGGGITQAEIAAKLGLSAPAFSRFFRAATGKTFVGFVNLLRVNQACRLLSSTTESVTRIAVDCGYENISNFNRQFLSLKGMNPSEYRLRAKSLGDSDQQLSRSARPKLVAERR